MVIAARLFLLILQAFDSFSQSLGFRSKVGVKAGQASRLHVSNLCGDRTFEKDERD
ncbi:hypothetical protein [Luteococcus japonicus]|uniref:hypothetical protein n=1 Tax=Luteococcus japonicus TaxID=33984 RepID=UPI001473778A|nr:hypothetical protein [Luteococcus japonicus]